MWQLVDSHCPLCANLISQPSLASQRSDKHPIMNPDRPACWKWACQLDWKTITLNYLFRTSLCLLWVYLCQSQVASECVRTICSAWITYLSSTFVMAIWSAVGVLVLYFFRQGNEDGTLHMKWFHIGEAKKEGSMTVAFDNLVKCHFSKFWISSGEYFNSKSWYRVLEEMLINPRDTFSELPKNFHPTRHCDIKKKGAQGMNQFIRHPAVRGRCVMKKKEKESTEWSRNSILFSCCLIERTINDNLRGDTWTPFTPNQSNMITRIQLVLAE